MVKVKEHPEVDVEGATSTGTSPPSNTRKRKVAGSNLTAVNPPSQGRSKRPRVKIVERPKVQLTEGSTSAPETDYLQPERKSDNVENPGTKQDSTRELSGRRSLKATTKSQQTSKATKKVEGEKGSNAMPLAARASGMSFKIGAHVSGAKGVHNAVTNAVHIGANAFAMFMKSQRKDEHRDMFRANCVEHKYEASQFVLPHGSYLVNLAQEEKDKADQAYNSFLDDLKRCEALGIRLYNFHPGSTGGAPRKLAIERIAAALNRAHSATNNVIPVLEAMAGSGNVIGSSFEDLRDIINLVQDRSRVGVCIDTAHVFAAGYDLRSPSAFQATFEKFDDIVGLSYLKAFHLNDSKAPLASNRDLHQNIGLGFLGLRAFHNIMNDVRFQNIPLVLETPIDKKDETGKEVEDKTIWAEEIKLLESLVGMDPDSTHFKTLESQLAQRGAAERQKYEEAFKKKLAKNKKQAKGQSKLSFEQK